MIKWGFENLEKVPETLSKILDGPAFFFRPGKCVVRVQIVWFFGEVVEKINSEERVQISGLEPGPKAQTQG